jgi:hypothetical protein
MRNEPLHSGFVNVEHDDIVICKRSARQPLRPAQERLNLRARIVAPKMVLQLVPENDHPMNRKYYTKPHLWGHIRFPLSAPTFSLFFGTQLKKKGLLRFRNSAQL